MGNTAKGKKWTQEDLEAGASIPKKNDQVSPSLMGGFVELMRTYSSLYVHYGDVENSFRKVF